MEICRILNVVTNCPRIVVLWDLFYFKDRTGSNGEKTKKTKKNLNNEIASQKAVNLFRFLFTAHSFEMISFMGVSCPFLVATVLVVGDATRIPAIISGKKENTEK